MATKIKFAVGAGAAEETLDSAGNYYEGDVPPKGVYRARVKQLKMKLNSSGDYMLNGVAEIEHPEDHKNAQYNGYGAWFNLNINRVGARWVNSFLDAIGADRKKFWSNGVVTDEGIARGKQEEPVNVVSIGGLKVPDDGIVVAFYGKRESYQGEPKLVPSTFVAVQGADTGPADEDEEELDEDEDQDEDTEEEDEDETEAYTQEELEELSLAELHKIAKDEFELTPKKLKNKEVEKRKIVEAILEAQDEDDDDDAAEPPF